MSTRHTLARVAALALALTLVPVVAGVAVSSAAGRTVGSHAGGHAGSTPYTFVRKVGDFNRTGHRGFPYRGHTENTRGSFEDAYRHRATAVETDLHLTRDGVPVLMHDADLRRTTTCRSAVAAVTLDWMMAHCRAKDGQRLWTADQMLAWSADHRINQILDFKATGWRDWTEDRLRALADDIGAHGMTERVRIMSNAPGLLDRVRSVAPQLHTQLIVAGWPGVALVAQHADGVNLYARELTVDRVAALHRAGILVLARNTDAVADWERIHRTHADGLLVNELAVYDRLL